MSRSINTRREVLPLAKLMLIWLYWWIHYLYSSESETVHIGIRMLVHFSCGYTYYKCTSEHIFLLIFLLFYYYKILVGNCFSTSLWIPSSSQMVRPQTRFHSNVNHSRDLAICSEQPSSPWLSDSTKGQNLSVSTVNHWPILWSYLSPGNS